MAIYIDCNATTPLEQQVLEEITRYLTVDFGNPGSRTHEYGMQAQKAVQGARDQIAAVAGAQRDDVIFTSGATESNNISLLGIAPHGEKSNKMHIISTQIEHKAVLEPLSELSRRWFKVTLIRPTSGGWVDPEAIQQVLQPDTLLVSVMQVNNETGVVQPIDEIAETIADHPAYFHTDAAQGFGKVLKSLQNPRIDLISISGHKIYGPKGVGALIMHRRKFKHPPLAPLLFGGGHERGLRPGTLPVHLIAGLGKAAELALKEVEQRASKCQAFKEKMLNALALLKPKIHGDPERTLSHVVNLSFPGLDSEAVMLALKDLVAISNGSACTSTNYEPSHVLKAMGLPDGEIQGALRWSWCHMTEAPDWDEVTRSIRRLL